MHGKNDKMSSRSLDKNFGEKPTREVESDGIVRLGSLVIPFSRMHSVTKEEFIYTGHERMPFINRHPAYQLILRSEFIGTPRRLRVGPGFTKFSTSF